MIQSLAVASSVVYSHEQNGLSEITSGRCLVQTARTMRVDTNAPEYPWSNSLVTAAYIANRGVSSPGERSLIEIWREGMGVREDSTNYTDAHLLVLPCIRQYSSGDVHQISQDAYTSLEKSPHWLRGGNGHISRVYEAVLDDMPCELEMYHSGKGKMMTTPMELNLLSLWSAIIYKLENNKQQRVPMRRTSRKSIKPPPS